MFPDCSCYENTNPVTIRCGFTSSVNVICCVTCLWVCSPWVQVWSGPALTGFLPSLLHLSLSLVTPARGETGLSEGEWQAKPVLTQHLKPPHKYRLPFPISKQPIHLCLHAYTLLHVMCRGVSLKMTTGHLVDSQRVGLWCVALQFSSTSAEPNPPGNAAAVTEEPRVGLVGWR